MRPPGPLVRGVAIAATLMVGASGAAVAQANRWEQQVRDQLQRALTTLGVKASERPAATRTGALNAEESEWFAVRLSGGVSYSIIGVCDNDCPRLQLVLSTPDKNELASDRSSENYPVLRFTPTETRLFHVKVVMDVCQVSPCWYGVAVARSNGGIERN
jgi:hypothetical protein